MSQWSDSCCMFALSSLSSLSMELGPIPRAWRISWPRIPGNIYCKFTPVAETGLPERPASSLVKRMADASSSESPESGGAVYFSALRPIGLR